MSSRRGYDVVIVGGSATWGCRLGIVLGDVRLRVVLFNIDRTKHATVEAGRMPFIEHDAEPVLQRVLGKTLFVADELAEVAQAELVLITVGTPVDEYLNPRLRPVLDLADGLAARLRRDQCLILRSTVHPGTSHSPNEFLKRRRLQVNIAYSPERIVQGYAVQELRMLPQIISGFTEVAVRCADELFPRLGVQTIPVTLQVAKLAKLFSNAWRCIQIAILNSKLSNSGSRIS